MIRKCRNYWTYEKCKEEFIKYKTKLELIQNNQYVYLLSIKNNWIFHF